MKKRDEETLMLLGMLALAAVALTRKKKSGPSSKLEASEPGWSHPLPTLLIGTARFAPKVSDGYGYSPARGRVHEGNDVMYRRRALDDKEAGIWPARAPDGSKWHFMPLGVPVRAARDGVVWSAKKTVRGWHVQLVHDSGKRATFYQHLASLTRPFKRGDAVTRGTVLGLQGEDPSNTHDPRHLHFELWRWDALKKTWSKVDPSDALAAWPVEHEHRA